VLATVALVVGLYQFFRARHERDVEARLQRWSGPIAQCSRQRSLPEGLVRAIIRCESQGDEHAVSGAGARGLMQITPITQQELLRRGESDGDLMNGPYNIRLGTTYLRILLDRFDGNVLLAVAAYNMGPTHLATLRAEHPELSDQDLLDRYAPAETQAYCRNVLAWQERYQQMAGAR
jgi:soluble lytic murein transglycosylase